MTNFIALYRGETVSGARLVALTADPEMVQDFATRLITEEPANARKPDLHLVEVCQPSNENKKGVRADQDMDPRHQPPTTGVF
jgi:hypothetical protein